MNWYKAAEKIFVLGVLPMAMLSACGGGSSDSSSETTSSGSASSRSLIVQEPVAAQSDCDDGLRLRWGNDDNANQTLEELEQVGTTLVCYSSENQANHFQITALSHTSSCSSGHGQQLQTGRRGANDGLEGDIQTYVICDSDESANSTAMAAQIERGKQLVNNVRDTYNEFFSDSTRTAFKDYGRVIDGAFSSDEILALYHGIGLTAIGAHDVLKAEWPTELNPTVLLNLVSELETGIEQLFKANGFTADVTLDIVANPLTSDLQLSGLTVKAAPNNSAISLTIDFPFSDDLKTEDGNIYRISMAGLQASVGNQSLLCSYCLQNGVRDQDYIDLMYPNSQQKALAGVAMHLKNFNITSTTGKVLSAAFSLNADVQSATFNSYPVLDLRKVDIQGTLQDEGKISELSLKAELPADGLGLLEESQGDVLNRVETAVDSVSNGAHSGTLMKLSNGQGYSLAFSTQPYETAIETALSGYQIDVKYTEKRITIEQEGPSDSQTYRLTTTYSKNDQLVSSSVTSLKFSGQSGELDQWLKQQLIEYSNQTSQFRSMGTVEMYVQLAFAKDALNSISLASGASQSVELTRISGTSFGGIHSGLSDLAVSQLEMIMSSNLSGESALGIKVSDFLVGFGDDSEISGTILISINHNDSVISAIFSLNKKDYGDGDIGVGFDPATFVIAFSDAQGAQMSITDLAFGEHQDAGWVRVDGNIVGRIVESHGGGVEVLFHDGSSITIL